MPQAAARRERAAAVMDRVVVDGDRAVLAAGQDAGIAMRKRIVRDRRVDLAARDLDSIELGIAIVDALRSENRAARHGVVVTLDRYRALTAASLIAEADTHAAVTGQRDVVGS